MKANIFVILDEVLDQFILVLALFGKFEIILKLNKWYSKFYRLRLLNFAFPKNKNKGVRFFGTLSRLNVVKYEIPKKYRNTEQKNTQYRDTATQPLFVLDFLT